MHAPVATCGSVAALLLAGLPAPSDAIAQGGVATFAPQADVRVDEATPATNYATSFLRTNGGSQPDVESFLRFSLTGLSGTVVSARLRLWVTNPAVWSAAADWDEAALTWLNRPPRMGSPVADKGAVAQGGWVEFDVTPLVTGDGTRTFVLATTSTDGIDMSSREGSDPSRRPQLVVSWQ